MARGVTNSITDRFTGNGPGQTFTLPSATDPDFPVLAHVVSVCTITGTVTGGALSYDVQLKDGSYIDSGQPSGSTGTVFRYAAIFSTSAIKGFRTRVAGWSGDTSASVVSTVVQNKRLSPTRCGADDASRFGFRQAAAV
jgi:hypothetical protein